MNLLIPDDSYVSVEEADKYHALRSSYSDWSVLDDETKARRLVSASDFVDINYQFLGEKVDSTQQRQFPRIKTGWGEDGAIPKAIKFAVCELALQEALNQNEEQKMSSVSVGPISVNYQSSQTSNQTDRFTYIKSLLGLYLDKRSGQVRLVRG
ncbi:DnaT-like ssDNA-binding protein [Gallibacterium genomosp. 3]|uniref:Putative DnaT-like domain-containing protein n=1 Tax=Gallibacterium genomosp. 3 TaxID=505345 RepID=A0A1A7PWT8_9PAST|nr:DnaT-like ssDNA-binding protein [Gallibacterium genomosp. 3]OBX06187.1 hypothetical protein QV07_08885 [Gallibacterium genomosp. 3]